MWNHYTHSTFSCYLYLLTLPKLALFQRYYNGLRVHQGLNGDTPAEQAGSPSLPRASLEPYGGKAIVRAYFNCPLPLEYESAMYSFMEP